MFKFVVLCALVAAAKAEPGVFVSPLTYSSNVIAPATTVLSSHPSGLVYSSPYISSAPLAYSAPLSYSHLIKKRSAPLAVSSYIAPSAYYASTPLAATYAATPLATTYTAAAPLATTYTAATPLATTYSHPIYATAAHLIKKRSAAFIAPTTYVAPSYVAPYSAAASIVPTTYAAAAPYVSTPLVSSAPVFYNHLIKKRSVLQPIAAYTAPASFSHTSRFDFQTSSPAITYSSYTGAAPLTYSSFAVPHVL